MNKNLNISEDRLNKNKLLYTQEKISILITGDFCPHKRIEQAFLKKEYENVFNGFGMIAKDSGLVITNLECPLTFSNDAIEKTGSNLKSHPDCIDGIKFGGFNVVTLANNHIMDYREQGLTDTIDACNKNNIHYVGAGQNIKEASKPLYLTVNERKIAIINFCENEWSIADKNKAGANPLNPVKNYYQIKEAKKNADILLVIIHGGHEHYHLPSLRMVETYRFFADLGVAAIIGHHTHCVSGYEIYDGTPIFYSLGNFIFDWENRENAWYKGYSVKLSISKDSIDNFSLIPYKQCAEEPKIEILKNKQKQIFLNRIDEYSKVISDSELLEKKWLEFCDSREKGYLSSLLSLGKFRKQLLKDKKLSRLVLKRKRLMPLLNLIRCEAYRDVAIETIQNTILKED